MVTYNYEDIDFKISKQPYLLAWLKHIISLENKKTSHINFIFCSDEYLLKMNQEHLQHDDYTDIITFDYCEGVKVAGDIFISIERVRENAEKFNVPFSDELHRVIIHGILHLLGYKDKTKEDKEKMTEMENKSLASRGIHLLS